VGAGFPSPQTRSVCAEIMLKQKDGAVRTAHRGLPDDSIGDQRRI
jgi:hypothetical protein